MTLEMTPNVVLSHARINAMSAGTMRDAVARRKTDFPRTVIDELAKRVAYLCSAPDCRAPTVAGKREQEGAAIVGDAAHIRAASPGGPRYDETMTDDARKS